MLTSPVLHWPLLALSLAAHFHYTTASPVIQWVNCSEHVPGPLQFVQSLGTPLPAVLPSPLPSSLHCGQLDVPMDYSEPISENNTVTLNFAMYRPSNPKGLLNFNPGGPAEETISFAWSVALNLTTVDYFDGLLDYDFLAMDVRGGGQTVPLNCSLDAFGTTFPSALPSNESAFNAFVDRAIPYAESCIALTSPPGVIGFMGTREVVQDWDRIRAALGYERMNLMTISYGTFQAETYARQFPTHAGRLVLDGVFPRGITPDQDVTTEIKTTNLLLERADAFCMADASCAFHSQGKGAVPKAFADVLALAANSSQHTNVSADDVRALSTLSYLYLTPDFAIFNSAVAAALQGNFSLFDYNALYAVPYSAGILSVMPQLCLDELSADYAAVQELQKAIATADLNDIRYTQHLVLRALCSKWPFSPTMANGTESTDLPMLLVTSDFDYNTPTDWANDLFQRSPNATLVVRHGDGHGSLMLSGPQRDIEIAYLSNGTLPRASNSSVVSVYPPGTGPRPAADPYVVPVGLAAGDASDP